MFPRTFETNKCIIEEVMWPMDDGVMLYTRITRPKEHKKCPIVFMRTPYEAAPTEVPPRQVWEDFDENDYINAGYCLIRQHVRGRGGSQGQFRAWDERNDGLCSLEHIRRLDCYMGEIYLLGESYTAAVHLSWLDTAPADVKGAALSVMCCHQFARYYVNGCNYDYCNLKWWHMVYDREYPQPLPEGAFRRPYRFPRPFLHVMEHILGQPIPLLTEYLLHDKNDTLWQAYPQSYRPEAFRIPILFTAGWYDRFLTGMLQDWMALPQEIRQQSAFLIGPWGHGVKLLNKPNCRPQPEGERPENTGLRWFEHLRKNLPAPFETGKVTCYSVGDGWTVTPYPVTEERYLQLNFVQDGTLSSHKTGAGSISYCYDPENIPTCFDNDPCSLGPEAGTVEGVNSFQSSIFQEDRHFCGHHKWSMTVSSDGEDTMFFLRLYLVEDGKAWKLTDIVTTLSHMAPDYVPGEKIRLELQTPLMAFTVKKGAAIRVDIASFCNIYTPHANVRGHWAKVTKTRVARNTLHLEDAHIRLTEKETNSL